MVEASDRFLHVRVKIAVPYTIDVATRWEDYKANHSGNIFPLRQNPVVGKWPPMPTVIPLLVYQMGKCAGEVLTFVFHCKVSTTMVYVKTVHYIGHS